MRVIVDSNIEDTLWLFYEEALKKYITLEYSTVSAKIERLRSQLFELGQYPDKYPMAKKVDWLKKGYHDFIYEDIHIGYKVIKLTTGESVVYVAEACHSLLYHD